MNLPRIVLSTLVLVAQAWPAYAATVSHAIPSCTMGCCAAVAEAEMTVCECSEESIPAAPVSTPPASGRDLVPQVTWVTAEPTSPLGRFPSNLTQTRGRSMECEVVVQPRVRLPVLFCSFLN